MRSQFPLFQSHLDLTYHYWKQIVKPDDLVIDATCGNGKDTLKLAQLALQNNSGFLYAYDIQAEAIASTQRYLTEHLPTEYLQRIQLIQANHITFAETIKPTSIKLIVYNLGYLPGGDKKITTETNHTLASLQSALSLIIPGGAISITCYPGHPEGLREEKSIQEFTASLAPTVWSTCYHQWLNRQSAPSLFFLQKALTNF